MGQTSKPLNIALIITLAGASATLASCSSGGNRASAAFADIGPVVATRGTSAITEDSWDALKKARKMANAHPENARFRSELGRAYLNVQLYGSAAASFEDAIAMGATNTDAAQNLIKARSALAKADGIVRQALGDRKNGATLRTNTTIAMGR